MSQYVRYILNLVALDMCLSLHALLCCDSACPELACLMTVTKRTRPEVLEPEMVALANYSAQIAITWDDLCACGLDAA